MIDAAIDEANRIPGDCGQEYRRPPYLTASGDLSHHLSVLPKAYTAVPVPDRPHRMRVDTGSVWESLAGYSRAVRVGDRILVSGTTATHGAGELVCKGDPRGQTVYILDKIAASLSPSAAASRTWCAPASSCATSRNGSRSRGSMAAISATSGRPILWYRLQGWLVTTMSKSKPRRW